MSFFDFGSAAQRMLKDVLQQAATRVYTQLGVGHREVVYQRALICELRSLGYWVQAEVPVPIVYRLESGVDVVLAVERADLVIASTLVVELKVGVPQGAPLQAALGQVRRYRKYLPGIQESVVVFFGAQAPEVRDFEHTACGT